jgi:hypothetical protein
MNTVMSLQSYKMPFISLLGEGLVTSYERRSSKEFVSKHEVGKFVTLVTNLVTPQMVVRYVCKNNFIL